MISEYALEPALLNRWERFRYLTENFGICHGRLISRYPKRWKAMVYESLKECTEIERKKIEVRLQFLDNRMLTRISEWNPQLDWLLNAEMENGKRPFHAIIAENNPRNQTQILIVDDLSDEIPLWHVEREKVIQRTAVKLADSVEILVANAREIIFIDPHFDPYKAKARNTLKAFIGKIVLRTNGIPIERIEFHTLYKPDIRSFSSECERQLPQRIPSGIKVRILRWKERDGGEGLHNRYILTERGGVRLAWGLDEGSPSQTDDISLLEVDLFKTRWCQYCGDNPAFDLAEEIIIVGSHPNP